MFGVCLLKSAIVVLCTSGYLLTASPTYSKSWPPMKSYDIWNTQELTKNQISTKSVATIGSEQKESFLRIKNQRKQLDSRNSKVLNFFPLSVDGECLSDDGRRYGICLNVYECRMQGGSSRGECALGFGVCCVFVAGCNQEIKNNVTYIVSPNFPSFMTLNLTSCRVKVRLISEDISQLRIDFNHFIMGQPNRTTGVCDGDIFRVTGGFSGIFTLCGQNSGQHIYYDVGGSLSRQAESQNAAGNLPSMVNQVQMNLSASAELSSGNISGGSLNNGDASSPAAMASDTIEILMNFTRSSLVSLRLWEIRVAQIPFSQRAPSGCLQYFTGVEGAIKTFNFADNGRHLANQHYRACIRQESSMCAISYEPCDDQSFRIGPSQPINNQGGATEEPASNMMPFTNIPENTTNLTPTGNSQTEAAQAAGLISPSPSATQSISTSTEVTGDANSVQDDDPDTVEGSGGSESSTPIPVSGGFDIMAFFRNTFGFGSSSRFHRKGRQFLSTCTDRITIPCIVEDFIESGMGPFPGCEPIHCGNNFCSSSRGACRIESTVTPFRVGVHFGDGIGKGYAEDNIGMCLKYSQVACL